MKTAHSTTFAGERTSAKRGKSPIFPFSGARRPDF